MALYSECLVCQNKYPYSPTRRHTYTRCDKYKNLISMSEFEDIIKEEVLLDIVSSYRIKNDIHPNGHFCDFYNPPDDSDDMLYDLIEDGLYDTPAHLTLNIGVLI